MCLGECLFSYLLCNGWQLHTEDKATSFTDSCWPYCNLAAALLDDLLYYCQSQSYAFAVNVSRALELTKLWEEFWKVFFRNTGTWIDNMYHDALIGIVIACFDYYLTFFRELECIFD